MSKAKFIILLFSALSVICLITTALTKDLKFYSLSTIFSYLAYVGYFKELTGKETWIGILAVAISAYAFCSVNPSISFIANSIMSISFIKLYCIALK